MTNDETFHQVAALLGERNAIDAQLAALIGRPALTGHLGEWIAAQVFGIELEAAANNKAIDGRFTTGPLVGKTVDVKWSLKREGLLDMAKSDGPDCYLVLAGPKATTMTSRNGVRPLMVDNVYLFSGPALDAELRSRGRMVGTATSVRAELWTAAEVYPKHNSILPLTDHQRDLLDLLDLLGS